MRNLIAQLDRFWTASIVHSLKSHASSIHRINAEPAHSALPVPVEHNVPKVRVLKFIWADGIEPHHRVPLEFQL